MFAQLTQFVTDHANQAIIVAGIYLIADDLLVFVQDLKARGWSAVWHAPQTTFTLIAEDVSTKAVLAIAGAGVAVYFTGGADPKQAVLNAIASGLVASAAIVLPDIRARFAALLAPSAPAPAKK